MTDKHHVLRCGLTENVRFHSANSYTYSAHEWAIIADPPAIRDLLTERDALREVVEKVSEALASYERYGEVCPFEGSSMIYADTLVELGEQARAALSK